MKVVIFTADSNGGYPVPAVKGGAVSTIIESLVRGNNEKELIDLTIVSLYDKDAKKKSKEYPNIKFIWIKTPKILKVLDDVTFFIVKTFFKNKKAISYKTIFSLFFYIHKSANLLKRTIYDKVVLENNILLAWIIKKSRYKGKYYYHFHNVPRINGKCQIVFDNCEKYFCVSNYVGNQIVSSKNAIGPIPKERVCTLYNCIDTELFKSYSEKISLKKNICKKYGIPFENKIIVLLVDYRKKKE